MNAVIGNLIVDSDSSAVVVSDLNIDKMVSLVVPSVTGNGQYRIVMQADVGDFATSIAS